MSDRREEFLNGKRLEAEKEWAIREPSGAYKVDTSKVELQVIVDKFSWWDLLEAARWKMLLVHVSHGPGKLASTYLIEEGQKFMDAAKALNRLTKEAPDG